jgi:CAAX protease family protein
MREALLAYGGATALCAAFWQARGTLGDWSSALIAATFIAVPWWLLDRRRADWAAYALTSQPIAGGLRLALVTAAIVFPLFFLGFLVYYRVVCGLGLLPMCRRFAGWGGGALRWPPDAGNLALAQVVAVALPEEFFFRGFLLGRLEEAWPARRRLWGAPVGRALVVSSALFALGHLLVGWNPLQLAVFFPGLVFGWMREKTGSILAGTLFHAMCNFYSEVLHQSFFG